MESEEYREPRNRNVWIIVAALLIVLCCCSLAAGSVFVSLVKPDTSNWGLSLDPGGERIEESFRVGRAPTLDIDNHAGSVTVRGSDGDEIHVVAIRKGLPLVSLGRIRVEMVQHGDRIIVKTRKPAGLSSGSVRLEITAPHHTATELDTGAGSVDVEGFSGGVDAHSGAGSVTLVDVSGAIRADSGAGSITMRDVSGEVNAHSGAGSINVRGGKGEFRLDTGTGSIDYEGELKGDSRFETGAGSITLHLPEDQDLEVDLETGVGTIHVGFPVDGTVTKREVRGTIGSGRDGSVYADTGTGGIDIVRH